MKAKPIFILHIPRSIEIGSGSKKLSAAETMDMFLTYLTTQIGESYHVIVLPFYNGDTFKTECYFVEKIEQKTIDEINAKIKNYYDKEIVRNSGI